MASRQRLPGTPTDQAPDILDCGRADCSALFLSMARRHPREQDADYLRWHALDHRPEQQRLAGVRTSLRVVSTPGCRAARAASDPALDAVDHVMTYFFADPAVLEPFARLGRRLRAAGRSPFILEPVERGFYAVEGRTAAPGTTAGSDVLPWVPAPGIYLLLERGETAPMEALADVAGIAGVWSARSVATAHATAGEGRQLHLCFLDEDPVAVARRLQPVLAARWRSANLAPLLAAPFYTVVPFEWDRYLP
jgi:hypothetical protein